MFLRKHSTKILYRSLTTATIKDVTATVSSTKMISDLIYQRNEPIFERAMELLSPDYQIKYSPKTPLVNTEIKLSLSNVEYTRRAVANYLQENIETVMSYTLFDMNFPGTHSVVIGNFDDVMIRLYATPPYQMHCSHVDWSYPFLRHPHRYNFISIVLAGLLINQRSQETSSKNGTPFHKYHFYSPVIDAALPKEENTTLKLVKKTNMKMFPYEIITTGGAYTMDHPEIHRVGFIPNQPSDWSIVLFLEYRDQKKESKECYSRHLLRDTPDIEKLYHKPNPRELRKFIESLQEELESGNKLKHG